VKTNLTVVPRFSDAPASTGPRRFAEGRVPVISCAAGLRRLDNIIWVSIALVAAFMLIAAIVNGFTIARWSFIAPASVCVFLKLSAHYYRDQRNDYGLASALESTAQLIAFSAVAAPLSYVAATASLPLQDAALAHLDHALSFDWKKLLALMVSWPRLFELMHVTYSSLVPQIIAAVLLLGFTGRLAWLRAYMLAFIFAALVTIAISTFLPAKGAWLYYGITDAAGTLPLSHTSWSVFFGLRDGSFRLLMGDGGQGIITFPSLHAALAVILIVAFWPVPIARWIAVAVNALMLMATPIDGSHYFVDVLTGIALALLCFAAARALVMRSLIRATAAATRGTGEHLSAERDGCGHQVQ
jgi:PAP2 superfamily